MRDSIVCVYEYELWMLRRIQYSTKKMGFLFWITYISIWRRQNVKGALFYMVSIGFLGRTKRVASNEWQKNKRNNEKKTAYTFFLFSASCLAHEYNEHII